MNKMELKVGLDDVRQHVVIELWMNGEALGHINLDGATAEQFMQSVAAARARLVEPVAANLDVGARLEAQVDPRWHIPGERELNGRALCLRHPGYGWLSFLFPEHQAAAIANWLTRDLPIKKPARSGP